MHAEDWTEVPNGRNLYCSVVHSSSSRTLIALASTSPIKVISKGKPRFQLCRASLIGEVKLGIDYNRDRSRPLCRRDQHQVGEGQEYAENRW